MKLTISEATLVQIRYWSKALQQANKCIRRRNKLINALRKREMEQRQYIADLHDELVKMDCYRR